MCAILICYKQSYICLCMSLLWENKRNDILIIVFFHEFYEIVSGGKLGNSFMKWNNSCYQLIFFNGSSQMIIFKFMSALSAWIPLSPKWAIDSTMCDWEPPCGSWEFNSGSLEQPVLLHTKSYLQPSLKLFDDSERSENATPYLSHFSFMQWKQNIKIF